MVEDSEINERPILSGICLEKLCIDDIVGGLLGNWRC